MRTKKCRNDFDGLFRAKFLVERKNLEFARNIEAVTAFRFNGCGSMRSEFFQSRARGASVGDPWQPLASSQNLESRRLCAQSLHNSHLEFSVRILRRDLRRESDVCVNRQIPAERFSRPHQSFPLCEQPPAFPLWQLAPRQQ